MVVRDAPAGEGGDGVGMGATGSSGVADVAGYDLWWRCGRPVGDQGGCNTPAMTHLPGWAGHGLEVSAQLLVSAVWVA